MQLHKLLLLFNEFAKIDFSNIFFIFIIFIIFIIYLLYIYYIFIIKLLFFNNFENLIWGKCSYCI